MFRFSKVSVLHKVISRIHGIGYVLLIFRSLTSTAEKDKAYFEDKLSATSVTLNEFHENLKSMSLKLDSSEQTIRTRE